MQAKSSATFWRWSHVSLALTALSLAACGGGDGGAGPMMPGAPASSTTQTQTQTQSVSGVVVDGPLQGATVCLDVNRNGACDTGEPTSGPTDAEGRYTIPSATAEQLADAPLIAIVPATAVDADRAGAPVGTAYQLSAPAGKHEVISPVTHLVQTGVVQGLSLPEAEAAVAAQLQVGAGSLYRNYVGSTSGDDPALATMAPFLVGRLQAGEQFEVRAAGASASDYTVRQLSFVDAQNYKLRYFYWDNTAADPATGLIPWYDRREGKRNGTAVASDSLYDPTLYATPKGWVQANGTVPHTRTAGNPRTTTWSTGYRYINTQTEIDVAGRPLSEVVRMAQDMTANTLSTIVGVDAAQLSGVMPTGARLSVNALTTLATPVGYREADVFTDRGVTTLAGLAAAFAAPVPGTVVDSTNTVYMGDLLADKCTAQVCLQDRLRAAFAAEGTVAWYLCDFDRKNNIQSNCTPKGTGAYAIKTAADGATPILSFAQLPAEAGVQVFTRVFVERNGRVYFGFQDKPEGMRHTGLNKAAFMALATALGIDAPH